MNVLDLAERLLLSEGKEELNGSLQMLQEKRFAGFYDKNKNIIRSILFLESIEEFLDFSKENSLEIECFCAAFLCAKGYGIQVGGYEDDLTLPLTVFFKEKGVNYPEICEIINGEKIYTDCSDDDNFKESLTAINQALSPHGMQVMVLEDCVYCDCEYTMLILDRTFAGELASSWQSDNFEIYLL